MITQKDAIAIGTAICAAAKRSTEEHTGPDNKERIAARGNAIYAMDNLWYDVIKPEVRGKFDYDRDKFYKACGWPE